MHKIVQEVLQKHQIVSEKVQSSMLEGSKLQYELGVLEERVKEADDFMDDFEQKVSMTDKIETYIYIYIQVYDKTITNIVVDDINAYVDTSSTISITQYYYC
jgi:hypothetical protein